jgi:hypothetical protein
MSLCCEPVIRTKVHGHAVREPESSAEDAMGWKKLPWGIPTNSIVTLEYSFFLQAIRGDIESAPCLK